MEKKCIKFFFEIHSSHRKPKLHVQVPKCVMFRTLEIDETEWETNKWCNLFHIITGEFTGLNISVPVLVFMVKRCSSNLTDTPSSLPQCSQFTSDLCIEFSRTLSDNYNVTVPILAHVS